ncbi:DNA repair protein complementing XP-G cells [Salarias fasciatus]|uniref:Excision repair cross-complementation group 5 n=1 Tax=Salarias fasciatus TaxID=181472 RepID=A0A672H457_SALFA|nr:DNA repair protein complementing XP-G cells [Salarias fasciatus]
MGVHGLWRLLESTGKPINPETLEGKILAVDISIWLNQAVKGVRDRDGNSVQNAHLLTLFHRICKLLFFRIKPVFVFDGDAPLLKKQTLALRRQRKEELTRESKQTNEKLLKTFLKRQAIKAALGDKSKEPLPSLSTVRRDEVDDMYVLPALPPAEEKDKYSSEEEEEAEEPSQWEETGSSFHSYERELYENPNSVDINSEEFSSLPPEMKHEILKDMKEFCKRRRTMFQKPPEHSGDFSQYQLAGLLQRNRLNQRLEGVEKEMSQQSAGGAPQLCQDDGDQQSRSVESHRLVSEDHSHYILIKDSKKRETGPDSRPAAAPWTGSALAGCRGRAADKQEPLWRPVHEEEQKTWVGSSKGSKPPDSKPSRADTSPPSPRTLKAIQDAMNDMSDEEGVEETQGDGSVSPRTLQAIKQALAEEGEGASGHMSSSGSKPTTSAHLSGPPVVVSSSEDEAEDPERQKSSLKQEQSLTADDALFDSSSEDEMEEVIGQRNKALRVAALQRTERETQANGEKTQLTEGLGAESEGQQKRQGRLEGRESEREPQRSAPTASSHNASSMSLSPQRREKPPSTETESQPVASEQTRITRTAASDGRKPESSRESDSEESFIDVSEDESKGEEAEESSVTGENKPPELTEDEMLAGEKSEESLSEVPGASAASVSPKDEEKEEEEDRKEENEESELKEEEETPATNEWENFDVEELEALESSLQVEQSHLREQQQQQERMANSVTGQMHLESQELLRLFGVPYLVAPMEAEAQCAALDRADQTHGTITDDSDVWLFGGRHVYKNFFSQNKYVQHYQYSDLQNQLGLDRTKMINLAYLLGSDYTEGVPGVGYVTGMEILNEFPGPGLEPLVQLSAWWSEAQEKKRLVADPRYTKVKKKLKELKLQPGFPNPAVAQAYLQPAVDQSDGSFSWGRPQLDMIKEFCLNRFGWNSRRTEETLQPVIKQLNLQQTQLRIDSFFRLEQQEKQAIRSQRLRRAVTCMKRKERGGGGEEDEDSEEEMSSPSKSEKGSVKKRKGEKEEEKPAAGGGFLGSEMTPESPLKSLVDGGGGGGQESVTVKPASQADQSLSVRTRNSSSSSGDDSDGGPKVAMVTARSVFEGSNRGRRVRSARGRGSTRGRGSLRGRGRGKKE